MTETTRPRANRDGHPCPEWCEVDHGAPVGRSGLTATYHGTEPPVVMTPAGYVQATAYQNGFDSAPAQIWIGGPDISSGLTMAPEHADRMAALAEMLAGATPEQHRLFAAQIRQAAAQVNPLG